MNYCMVEDLSAKRNIVERIQPVPHNLREGLRKVQQTIARARVQESLRNDFLKALDSVQARLPELEAKEMHQAPNAESVIILSALMFLAADHGGRKAVVRTKDAFAKYFPEVEREVWLGVQKAANPQ